MGFPSEGNGGTSRTGGRKMGEGEKRVSKDKIYFTRYKHIKTNLSLYALL